jgi:sugar/nucleoside kinase (ribokinase family)
LAASYFTQPHVVAVVGEDFGDDQFRVFHEHGVDVEGVERAPGKTFFWQGRYRDNFKERDTLSTCLNVFEHFRPKLPENYRAIPYLFLGNIDPEQQASVLDQMTGLRYVAMDTMNYWIAHTQEALRRVLARVDLLFINDEEAFQLSGEGTLKRAAERILAMGPKAVVIKRGEFGAALFGPDGVRYSPAVLLDDVEDPTGAGDSFAGGFMGWLAREDRTDPATLARALRVASAMASFTVERFSVDGLRHLDTRTWQERLEAIDRMLTL